MSTLNLSQIYSSPNEQQARYSTLRERLAAKEAELVTFVRAPGRVNMISEHTDYNGYEVFPIAIERDFAFAVGKRAKDSVLICHVEESAFPCDEFNFVSERLAYPTKTWSMYARAGLEAARMLDASLDVRGAVLVGCGTVPQGSGLSSSSALVCSAALGFLAFSSLGKEELQSNLPRLAEFCAKSEALVAIEGGGMDQAVSLNAVPGKVCCVSFNPLSIHPLFFLEGIRIAVFSSLRDSRKATGACNFYNTRVAECRACCALLWQVKTGKKVGSEVTFQPIMGLEAQKLFGFQSPAGMLSLAESLPERCSLGELQERLGFSSLETLLNTLFATKAGGFLLENSTPATVLTIRSRIAHVFSEAYRALVFRRTLSMPAETDEDYLQSVRIVADLMADSHASCRDAYECSCPELEEVIRAAKTAGAFAARLTGAGMGGFAVGLVHQQDAEEFLNKMKQFYVTKGVKNLDDVVFITEPAAGASYVSIE